MASAEALLSPGRNRPGLEVSVKPGLAQSTRRSRKRETSPADAVEAAKATLQRAVDSIDDEIADAKERADEAKAEYEAMKASATERKHAITAKINALDD